MFFQKFGVEMDPFVKHWQIYTAQVWIHSYHKRWTFANMFQDSQTNIPHKYNTTKISQKPDVFYFNLIL